MSLQFRAGTKRLIVSLMPNRPCTPFKPKQSLQD